MPTLQDVIDAKKFSEGYLGCKFKDNQEFWVEIFEDWWYNTPKNTPLGEFLRDTYLAK